MSRPPSTIKAAAALAEFAAHAAQTIASGKQIDEYTLAMIQKHAGIVCGCDPNDGYADAIAQIEADEEAEAEREHYEWKREQRLSWGGMVGMP